MNKKLPFIQSKFFKRVLIVSVSILFSGILGYLYLAYLLPLPANLENFQNIPTTKIYDRNGELLYEVLNPENGKKTFLPLSEMPKKFLAATIFSEDSDFYSHVGVDLNAIFRAFLFNTLEQKIVSGGSTITQQLVRNLLGLNRERNLQEKIIEAAYAIRLSHYYTKDQILEQYLNTVYYGNMAYGCQSAALDYFGKNLYDLDLAEMTLLAGLPQSPSRYNPFLYFDHAKQRQKYVLSQLVKNNEITQKEADNALAEPLKFRKNQAILKAPHFVQYILNNLEETYGEDKVYKEGLKVTTTLDYSLQQIAERVVEKDLEKLKDKHVGSGALLSVDVASGQILAWVGSKNYYDESIDGQVDVVTSLRQPGSALKPFLYLMAFENGFTPATILEDIPSSFSTDNGAYTPQNYDLKYHGPVRIRTALANSYNIPAVRMEDRLGTDNFLQFLRKLGITTLNQPSDFYGLSLTLGGGEVTLYDMVSAYSVLANSGQKSPLLPILKIEDLQGNVISGKDFHQLSSEIKSPGSQNNILGSSGAQNAYLITNILSDPTARLNEFGEGNVLELSVPAAAKTGTTRNFKDNWTFGYTPTLLTGVWVGNPDATAMQNISGIDGAGPIWHDFMEQAVHTTKFSNPNNQFPVPTGLTHQEICAISGLKPTPLCSNKIYEWFLQNNAPKTFDNYYQRYNCPAPNSAGTQEKILIDYPLIFKKWAEGQDLAIPSGCTPIQNSQEQQEGSKTGQSAENSQASAEKAGDLGKSSDYPDAKNQQATNTKPLPDPIFKLLSPSPGDSYQIDKNIPLESQKIPIRFASQSEKITNLTLYIDDNEIVEPNNNVTTYLWLPKPGIHSVKFTWKEGEVQGESPKTTFEVI